MCSALLAPLASKLVRPWVLIPACVRELGGHPFHVAGDKYLAFVRLSGGRPLILPAGERDPYELTQLLDLCDGVLLPGSPSNVHPRYFDQSVLDTTLPLDPHRDAFTLSLIPQVLQRGIPLFAICRGFQEVNVALGGSLHQAVHELPQHRDHRGHGDTLTEQYRPAHAVRVAPGGLLSQHIEPPEFEVNSLHGQGIDRLAPGLRIEATSTDGLIEAFSWPQSRGFNLSVQWHPEWQAQNNEVSVRLFKAFGQACLDYRHNKSAVHEQAQAAP